ncbi:MAG: DNA internalization-related competence protein ComEC/Rec2 [Gammaproteobacteria bacterium]|nr:DNA internalization-related competence protein ComEC/Rec2 [Gammaproteobacteria bacterium]
MVLPLKQIPLWCGTPLWFVAAALFGIWLRHNRGWVHLLILLAGALWMLLHASLVLRQQIASDDEGVDRQVLARVVDLPQVRTESTRLLLELEQWDSPRTRPARVLVNWRDAPTDLAVGSRWRMVLRLKRPNGFSNPGGFDYERWLFQRRIGATGYVRIAEPDQIAGGWSTLRDWPNRLRQGLDSRLQPVLADLPYGGLMRALVLGARDRIEPAQQALITRFGLNHLVAISGLHIGWMALLGMGLGRWLWSRLGRLPLRLPSPRAGALLALSWAVLYALLAGFSVPTQRALVMVAAALAGILWGRQSSPWAILALAFLAVLLADPLSLLGVGFWLSFWAVTVILWSLQGRQARGRAGSALRVQLALTIGLMPLLVVAFGRIPLGALAANLVAVPLFGLLVIPPLLLGVLVTLLVPALGAWLFVAVDLVLQALFAYVGLLDEWLPVTWFSGSGMGWTLFPALVGVLWLLAPRGVPGRLAGSLLLLPLLLNRPPGPEAGEFAVTTLDVGQGLAVLVETENHALLYDVGARFSDRFDSADAVVLPYLRSRGIEHLDRLIISHDDNDHAGALGPLVAGIAVGEIFAGQPKITGMRLPESTLQACFAGDTWQWDGVVFRVLSPPRGAAGKGSDNDRSCVLQISAPKGSALIPGDISATVERRLVRLYGDRLDADLLLVPHHGSHSASSWALLAHVSPVHGVVSAGYRNRYRHPAERVVQRYQQAGVVLHNTANQGAVRVTFSEKLQVQHHRSKQVGFWVRRGARAQACDGALC